MPSRFRSTWIALALLATTACGSSAASPPPRSPAAAAAQAAAPVAADAFAGQLVALLGEAHAEEDAPKRRSARLSAVMARQLLRAAELFARDEDQAGLVATEGALLLARAGELERALPAAAHSREALLGAVREVARAGDEGRAQGLYGLLERILGPGPQQQEVREHLTAIDSWLEATRGEGPMLAAHSRQRAAVGRSLVDASERSLDEAADATRQWVRQALRADRARLPPRTRGERDELIESDRARMAGAFTLAAVFLRHGDAEGALAALGDDDVARVTRPSLRENLRKCAEDDDAAAWYEIYSAYRSVHESSEGQALIDPSLARAAAWGAAVRLYRADPSSMRGSMPLATALLQHRMAEAGVTLLTDAAVASRDERAVSWALGYVLQAIVAQEEVGDIEAARRTFAQSRTLLDAAQATAARLGRQSGQPSVGQLYYVMGAIETRAGEIERAQAHLLTSIELDPAVDALLLLSAVQRQRGALEDAVSSLRRVVELGSRAADAATIARAQLSLVALHRQLGDLAGVQTALHQGLSRALDARATAQTHAQEAGAERALARALGIYGEHAAARRALDRAFDASASDLRQLSITLLESASRALVRGDLAAGRQAVRRAREVQLPDADLVYTALWLGLTERRLGVASDGTAEDALMRIGRGSGWAARLAAWARGKLSDEQLLAKARTRIERVEAEFYVAMRRHVQAPDAATLRALAAVAGSEAIELVEVEMARQLVADAAAPLALELPAGVTLP